eukprot:1509537-Rhodomonas_salina.5
MPAELTTAELNTDSENYDSKEELPTAELNTDSGTYRIAELTTARRNFLASTLSIISSRSPNSGPYNMSVPGTV